MADKKQNAVKYGEVVAKCWEDEAYRKRFLEDPESVLAEAGFAVEEGVTYKVVEQPKNVKYIVLPCEEVKGAVQAVAKNTRSMPDAFLAASGHDVTPAFLAYARPLVGPLPPCETL